MYTQLYFRSAFRLLHQGWCWRGPRWLVKKSRLFPRKIARNHHLYYDYPTIFIAAVSHIFCRFIESRKGLAYSRFPLTSLFVGTVLAVGAGTSFHALSVLIFARRKPWYDPNLLKLESLAWTVLTAAAEEDLWGHQDENITKLLCSVSGFALLHYPLNGFRAVAHMMIFGLIARRFEYKYGWLSSVVFHTFYNIATEVSTKYPLQQT